MSKAKYFSFSKKLLVIFCVPFILICIITTVLCSSLLRKNLYEEIKESLHATAVSINSTYDNLYEGEYRRSKTFALYKGDTQLTGKTEYIDAICKDTGVEISIYYEGKIEITTLMREAGGRGTGLELEGEIREQLAAGEEVFQSNYLLENNVYFGYFIPLKNDDTVVGAIFAGKKTADVENKIDTQVRVIVILLVAIMAAFLVFLFGFSRYLASSMRRTSKFLKSVANGELSEDNRGKEVKNHDEIGDIYRIAIYLQQELKRIVTTVKSSAEKLLTSSGKLNSMSQEIHERVGRISDSAEQIASDADVQATESERSVERVREIGEQIEYVHQEMESLQKSISNMSQAEGKSQQLIHDFSVANGEVMYAVDEIASQIMITNDSVQQIQNTIDIIRDIAEETDLLSINASIEAAHAGDAGRGFSVIAEEINHLAAQSAQNAVIVERTIVALKQESEKMVAIMDKVKSMMTEQNGRLEETITNYNIVEDGVEHSARSVTEVRGRMDELTESKNAILENIRKQATIAERFVATTENVTEMVRGVDERMKGLEQTADGLEDIANDICAGLDVFKI